MIIMNIKIIYKTLMFRMNFSLHSLKIYQNNSRNFISMIYTTYQ